MYATSTLTVAVPFGICTQFSILHQFLLPKPWHLNTDIVFQYYTYPEIYGQGHLIHLNNGVILLISSFLATAITFFLPCELHHNAAEQRFCYYFLKTVPKKGVFSPISRGENRTALFQEGGDAYEKGPVSFMELGQFDSVLNFKMVSGQIAHLLFFCCHMGDSVHKN